MLSSLNWGRVLGIRSSETHTVWLFFLHNFLLGIGTILVYVSANVVLLENHPEHNLPLAYVVAAMAMMGVGKAYAYFEHHWLLQHLSARVLGAVILLTGIIGVLLLTGPSVAAAVGIMAGYRMIYLLTNLEFWGVSALAFDVRQSKRLFSIISSGDMPAKAMGAVLAILVHAHTDLFFLLFTAFCAYLAALYVLRNTFQAQMVEMRAAPRRARAQATPRLRRQLFGDSRMVLAMCLGVAAVAAVTTGVEYFFFVNVKQKFHDQAALLRNLGSMLALTYLLATAVKVLLSGPILDRLGVRLALAVLPGIILVAVVVFGGLRVAGVEESVLLGYYFGLYVALEVLRRAVFDPVFLVLFQALTPPERLQGHTLAKAFYEPAGLALGGVLLMVLHNASAVRPWVPFAWMAGCLLAALYFLRNSYHHYLDELKNALSFRFAAAEIGPEADHLIEEAPAYDEGAVEPLLSALKDKASRARATEQLVRLGEAAVPALATAVAAAPHDAGLLRRIALVCGRISAPGSKAVLLSLAQQENLVVRAAAFRALRNFPAGPAEAPLFHELLQQELRLAQHLLRGQAVGARQALRACLDYELSKCQQRMFALLQLLYPTEAVADAQRGIAQAARERQANALEMLDNLIPRPVYQGLHALLETAPLPDKIRSFNRLLGRAARRESVISTILRRGETAFSDWTISETLLQWQPTPATVEALYPHLQSDSPLVLESAQHVWQRLPLQAPEAYAHFRACFPDFTPSSMNHETLTAGIPARERVLVLKGTALFAETPENVLSSIVPIMKEVAFQDGHQIFAKGDLGTSLFILYAGEVNIFNGSQQLTTFRKGDFFGELALLDTEPRSATAVAAGPVVAFRLDQEDFYDVMEERGEVLRNILRVLCQRLRRQNEKL